MQEEKKEKYINGEIYGEKNQIIVANKIDSMQDENLYKNRLLTRKKLKITEEMAEKVLDRTG